MQKSDETQEIKRRITAQQFAHWIAEQRGEKANRSGQNWRVGKGRGGSIVVSDSDNGPIVCDHAQDIKGGDILTVIQDITGADFKAALEIAAEIANFTPQQPQQPQPKQKQINVKRVYDEFTKKNWEQLRSAVKSDGCRRLFKLRGLDEFKIENCPNVGYTTKETFFYKDGKGKGHYIPENSLVFRDEKRIKALPFRNNGKRDDWANQITDDGNCQWIPYETLPHGDLWLTEGECDSLALIWNSTINAIPCKPDGANKERMKQWAAEGRRIILAYDNDNAGHDLTAAALQIVPNAIDVSFLWGEGKDPNDFVAEHKNDCIQELLLNALSQALPKSENETQEPQPEQNETMEDPTSIDAIRQYFLDKSKKNVTESERRAMQDPVFGAFVQLLDPYRMRKHAPACVFVAWGLVRLSQYHIKAPSNPRIVNLVCRSGAGKNWTLGTLRDSKSLYYQLTKDPNVDAYKTEDSSVTGNGLSLDALNWASNSDNARKCRVGVWTEFGNAQTRGYAQEERAGSIGNYDVALCDGFIQKPRNKRDIKDLKDLENSYPYMGCEVRAYQNINGSKVVVPRFRGSGEARREFWFFMSMPTDDPAFNDHSAPFVDNALRNSAFMPEACDEAFKILSDNALPFTPCGDTFDDRPDSRIKTDAIGAAYIAAYEALLKTVTNTFYRANKCELLRDKLTFCAGLSAGMHGRKEANEDDYWIAAYLCECLAESLDSIMDCGGKEDDPNTERSRIIERLQAVGVKGVRSDKLSSNKKLLAELAGETRTKDGFAFEPDADIFWRYELPKANKRYFIKTADVLRTIDADKERFRVPF